MNQERSEQEPPSQILHEFLRSYVQNFKPRPEVIALIHELRRNPATQEILSEDAAPTAAPENAAAIHAATLIGSRLQCRG